MMKETIKIDVRTEKEFNFGDSLEGAINVPFTEFDKWIHENGEKYSMELFCGTGTLSVMIEARYEKDYDIKNIGSLKKINAEKELEGEDEWI